MCADTPHSRFISISTYLYIYISISIDDTNAFNRISSSVRVQWRYSRNNKITIGIVKVARSAIEPSLGNGGGGGAGGVGGCASRSSPDLKRTFADSDFAPLVPTKVYCVATSSFLAGGGDDYSMLAAAPSTVSGDAFREAIGSFISAFTTEGGKAVSSASTSSESLTTTCTVTACPGGCLLPFNGEGNVDCEMQIYSEKDCDEYSGVWCAGVPFFNANGLVMVPADAASSMIGPRTGQFVQIRSLVSLQLGLLCIHSTSAGADREECDHMLHTVDLINDKTDGFYDDVLEYAHIDVVEVECGCSENTCVDALKELQVQMPMLTAAIGPSCSSDVAAVGSVASRSETGFDGVFISASSTAPSLANTANYPSVARVVASEVHNAAALAAVIQNQSWQNIAIVHDDSVWGSESATAFISSFKAMNFEAGLEANILNNNSQ